MRLAGIEKMGYYPTPASLLDAIASYVGAAGGRLLDPCCGRGEAAATVARLTGCVETWGAELSAERAAEAAKVLTKVHATAWESCKVGRGVTSLLFLNPPYDSDATTGRRLELTFLENTSHALAAGGVLIYIVPQQRLGDESIARHIAGRYTDIRVVRFPDGEFEAFDQVVLFGTKLPKYHVPGREAIDAIKAYASLTPEQFPVLTAQEAPLYEAPSAPEKDADGKPSAFRRMNWEPEELLAAAKQAGVRARSAEWRDALAMTAAEQTLHPAMPLKKGHVAMLMAAGLMGVMRLQRADGSPLLAKGRVVKSVEVSVEETEDVDGKTRKKTVHTDRFLTEISTLTGTGEVTTVKDTAALVEFMSEFGDALASQVIARHTPEYDLKPTPGEWAAVSRIARDMKLPNRKETGLLPAQKHIALAAARVLRKQRAAILNCEMGFGKTVTAIAVIEALNAYPAIVVCPPHLVRKWANEIERANPGCKARIVNCVERGAYRPDPDADEAGQRGGRLPPIPPYSIMDFVRDWKAGRLGERAIAVLSRERAKLASGWAPVALVRKVKTESGVVEYLADPDTGAILTMPDGKDRVPVMNDVEGWKHLSKQQRFSREETPGWGVECDDEGRPVRSTGRWGSRPSLTPLFTQGQGGGDFRNLPYRNEYGELVTPPPILHKGQVVGYRRYPVASFIHRKLKGFFKAFIADEVHQFKAAATDQAVAFHQISRASKWTLGLTGTLFGGKSTSIFHLGHRLIPAIRAEFGPDDERRWAARYGVLEITTYDGKGNGDSEDGAFSGYRRKKETVKELPGVSPAIIEYMLGQTLFGRVTDLGYALPAYEESIVRLDMDPAQAEQYHEMVYDPRSKPAGGLLYQLMKDSLQKGSQRLVSVWLQAALSRPNSSWRDDDVMVKETLDAPAATVDTSRADQRRKVLKGMVKHARLMTLQSVVEPGEWTPKERWLAGFCSDEVKQGRKVLVYLRQTGERDIRPRLVEALKAAGLRVSALDSAIPPIDREAWVKGKIDKIDVLLTNPKLVETGLDLVMFHSVVFYEPEYSLYMLWQAMRRVWRLGQTRAVKVVFLSYRNTMEEAALSLIGKKIYAAQLLYGDEVGGAIVETDDGSLLTQLARQAIEGVDLDDLTSMFAAANRTTTAIDPAVEAEIEKEIVEDLANGPVAAVSTIQAIVQQKVTWDEMRRMAAEAAAASRRRQRNQRNQRAQAEDGQPTLFDTPLASLADLFSLSASQ